jgi:tight adherence protein C
MITNFLVCIAISTLAGLGVREAILAAGEKTRAARRRVAAGAKESGDFIISLGRSVGGALPEEWRQRLSVFFGASIEKQLIAAGRRDIEPMDIVGLRIVFIIAGLLVALAWFGLNRSGLALGITSAVLLQLWPEKWLISQAQIRHRVFSKLLPEFTELAALAVGAGLSLDRGIELYCLHFENPVAETFSLVLDEIAIGKSRRRALLKAAGDIQMEMFTALTAAIFRAEKLGTPLADVLKDQARSAREFHEESVRELSATAPVRMLGPIAGLILPALFIVVLGPALLRFL